ncbi:MAG: hypothetical protein ACWA41_06165 [Putridiphycobacter sp.]
MKRILTIILILIAVKAYNQQSKYEYFDFDCSESFLIKTDSFIYKHSCGLMYGVVSGTVNYANDTLLLNSDIQPTYNLIETFDSTLNKGVIVVTIKNLGFPNSYGFRVFKGDDYYDLNLQDNSLVTITQNKQDSTSTFSFNSKLLSRKEKLCFVLYRTNLRIELKWKNMGKNKFELEFKNFPDVIDYHFFTNQKAIIDKGNLILLDKNGNPEKTKYTISTKKKIKISKKKKVKKYKKSS